MTMIQNILLAFLKHYHEKYMKHRRKDVIYVHELCQCYMKAMLQKELTELHIVDIESINDKMIIGEAIHEGMLQILKHVEASEPEEKCKEIKVNDETVTICGTADAIIEDTVIEIKYVSRSDRIIEKQDDKISVKPMEHHVRQARLYGWLYDTSNVMLLYVTPIKIVTVQLEPYSDSDVVKIVSDWLNLKPSPLWEWECNYCRLKRLCPCYRG